MVWSLTWNPDILECEVKWALGSITMNKASGGDGIPVELFQTLKVLWKWCCTQYASKFGKLRSGHKFEKGQFSFQSQRKAMPKNVQVKVKVTQSCPTLCDPWTVAHQVPPSMGFSRQEYWSGLPFPSPGDLPNPGIEPKSPTLQADALTSATREAQYIQRT